MPSAGYEEQNSVEKSIYLPYLGDGFLTHVPAALKKVEEINT